MPATLRAIPDLERLKVYISTEKRYGNPERRG